MQSVEGGAAFGSISRLGLWRKWSWIAPDSVVAIRSCTDALAAAGLTPVKRQAVVDTQLLSDPDDDGPHRREACGDDTGAHFNIGPYQQRGKCVADVLFRVVEQDPGSV